MTSSAVTASTSSSSAFRTSSAGVAGPRIFASAPPGNEAVEHALDERCTRLVALESKPRDGHLFVREDQPGEVPGWPSLRARGRCPRRANSDRDRRSSGRGAAPDRRSGLRAGGAREAPRGRASARRGAVEALSLFHDPRGRERLAHGVAGKLQVRAEAERKSRFRGEVAGSRRNHRRRRFGFGLELRSGFPCSRRYAARRIDRVEG